MYTLIAVLLVPIGKKINTFRIYALKWSVNSFDVESTIIIYSSSDHKAVTCTKAKEKHKSIKHDFLLIFWKKKGI